MKKGGKLMGVNVVTLRVQAPHESPSVFAQSFYGFGRQSIHLVLDLNYCCFGIRTVKMLPSSGLLSTLILPL